MKALTALSFLFLLLASNGLAQDNVEMAESSNDASQQEPKIVAVEAKEPCLGCVIKLNTNLDGLSPMLEMAIQDVESERDRKQILLELIDLERQIVSGVKYGFTFKLGSTICQRDRDVILSSCLLDESIESEYCKVEFLQKPWLSKDKYIIHNNCTTKIYSYPEDISKEINDKKDTPNRQLSLDDMAEIESQMIPESSFIPNIYDDAENGINNRLDDEFEELSEQRLENVPNFDPDYVFYRKKRQSEGIAKDPNTSEDSKSSEEKTKPLSRRRRQEPVAKDPNTSEDSQSSEENAPRVRRQLSTVPKDPNTSEDSKSSEEKLQRVRRQLEQKVNDPNTSESNSTSSEEVRTRTTRDVLRFKRGSNNNDNNNNNNGDSSSSSSSSSSDDDNNNNGDDNHIEKGHGKKQSYQNKNGKDDNDNGDDNDTSSSSSDDDNGNNGKNRHKRSTETDFDEKKIIDNLALYATTVLDTKDDDDSLAIPVSVLKIKKSILEGFVYYLKVMVSDSKCPENKEILKANNLLTYKENIDDCANQLIDNSERICKFKIHISPSFANPKILDSRCHEADKEKSREKRSFVHATVHVPEHAMEYVMETIPLLDGKTAFEHRIKPLKIIRAIQQSGDHGAYTIRVLVGVSQCLKSDPDSDITLCPVDDHYPPFKCTVLVKNDHRTVNCNNGLQLSYRQKRQVGAPRPESVDDPEVISMTKGALQQLDSQSAHENKYKIIKIHGVTKQVVAGLLYKIRAEIVLSDCPKSDSKDTNLCGINKEAESQICEISVWTRPWIKINGTETTVKCGGDELKFRSRRSVDGDLKDYQSFQGFKKKYNVDYQSGEEEKRRFKIFKANLDLIKLFNGGELGSAKYGITRFVDLTQEEFKKTYLGFNPNVRREDDEPFPPAEIPDIELPKEFDWRNKGAVTEVKDQGSCGSCWAFSTTGNIEGQYAIKHGKLLEFSEQELVDCDSLDEGCGGGLMDNAYRAIEKLGGLELESDYPYDAKNEKCHFNKTLAKVQLTGALNISQNEDDMAKWLTVNGPISIAINANAMQFYVGGVSHPWKFLCNPKSLDHGVLIVGYGVHSYPKFNKTLPYWLVKNSWGTRWGEQGYYKVYRGDGTCGVNQTPSSGVVA